MAIQETALRDYGHREWGGMLKDYYYPHWKSYLTYLEEQLEGKTVAEPDLYPAEREWVESHNEYKVSQENPVTTANLLF